MSFAASPLIVALGLALWAWTAWLCRANWERTGRRPSGLWLEGLRVGLVTLLLLTLFRPEIVRIEERNVSPRKSLILTDASDSMKTAIRN